MVSFIEKVNKEDKFGDFSYCPHNRGCPLNKLWCPLNTGFTVIGNNLVKSPNVVAANIKFLIATSALWIENLSQYKIL